MEQIHIEADQSVFVGEPVGDPEVVVQPETVAARHKRNAPHRVTQVTAVWRGGGKVTKETSKRRGAGMKSRFFTVG